MADPTQSYDLFCSISNKVEDFFPFSCLCSKTMWKMKELPLVMSTSQTYGTGNRNFFKIFQMSFSNRMLFMNIGHLSCSPDPTANSKTTNPNFHKIFGQFICNLIGYKGQLISKCPCEKTVSSKIPTKIFLEFCPEILRASWGLNR